MTHKFLTALLAVVLIVFSACNTSKKSQREPIAYAPWHEDDVDTDGFSIDSAGAEVTEAAPTSFRNEPYKASYARTFDLLHTSLMLNFDWDKELVMGRAVLTMKPLFFNQDSVVLHAKNFTFKSVSLGGLELKHNYLEDELTVYLPKTLTRRDTVNITIDYTAKPSESEGGGSSAITSDKGLFFINPRGEDPESPRQIWTQGETENNSRWFPTIDRPNERMTTDITITVPDSMVSLSNGIMTKSNRNADGTRTDTWVMNQPHAPYLVMLAIGQYAVVKDKWRNIDVNYYVEPAYESHAKAIFPYTPEMLTFFSNKYGLDYPWQKYSQVVVRDFVSGAMENTTAVIFGDFVQATTRDLVDVKTNELVVAHEMAHHWFGDYVTCESWSNLTLNEGFANYAEYLWFEQKHGRDAAEVHRRSEIEGYLGQAGYAPHPLVHFHYTSREDMFDAHSYNKGGLVLHMLRNEIGDDAFFEALKYYLNKNAYTDVEVHELRLAFEDITGRDLNWFFNQWFSSNGHPVLEFENDYMPAEGAYRLTVRQVQNQRTEEDGWFEVPDVFVMPADVLIVNADGSRRTVRVTLDKQENVFTFDTKQKPQLVVFDPAHTQLFETNSELIPDEQTAAAYYTHSNQLWSRFDAIEYLPVTNYEEVADAKPTAAQPKIGHSVAEQALNDPDYSIRQLALNRLMPTGKSTRDKIANLALTDPHADVRETAIQVLEQLKDKTYAQTLSQVIQKDASNRVVGQALTTLGELDPAEAMRAAEAIENSAEPRLLDGIFELYVKQKATNKLPFFVAQINKLKGYDAIGAYIRYAQLASKAGDTPMLEATQMLLDKIETTSSGQRIGAFAGLTLLRDKIGDMALSDKIATKLETVQSEEKNPQMREVYQQIAMMVMFMNMEDED